MTLSQLCALRDQLIQDPSLSNQEKDHLYATLQDQIYAISSSTSILK